MGFKTQKIAAARAFYDAAFAALGGGVRMEIPKDHTGARWSWAMAASGRSSG